MSKATRQAFGEALAKLGETHPEIVVLDADLAKSTKSEIFARKFPNRFFEMGISEANMIGAAAGMSFVGKIPFACSFGAFITGRYDTIRLSVVYADANDTRRRTQFCRVYDPQTERFAVADAEHEYAD